jgi:phosphatidylinositol alpha-1,6-mannosyltransferase
LARRLRAEADVGQLVGSTHGHEVWWSRTPGTRRALHRIGEDTDALTYVATYTRDRVARALSAAAAARMAPLRPGVDTEVFHPGTDGEPVRERYGLRGRPVVVCVSRLVKRKGQDTLVRALPLLHRRVPDAALLLVGDGPMRRELARLAADLGVARDVVLAGSHPWHELPPFFAAGDVFAMPTRSRRGGLEVEAFGIVYLEAAACGLPVVVGDSGGAPDTVVEGETGHVVDGGSPAQVADRLAGLLLDPDRSARMGAAGRARVEREFTWDLAAARLRDLLRVG